MSTFDSSRDKSPARQSRAATQALQSGQIASTNLQLVKNKADFIVERIPHDRIFLWREIYDDDSDWVAKHLRSLSNSGIIKSVGECRIEHERADADKTDSHYVKEWVIKSQAVEVAHEIVENRDSILPCGHNGITNHGDGEFSCLYEDCSRRFRGDFKDGFVELGVNA